MALIKKKQRRSLSLAVVDDFTSEIAIDTSLHGGQVYEKPNKI